MSDKIKPSEVSQVLLEQLKGINDSAKFDEVGSVLQVSDGVARIYGLRNAEANELLEFENETRVICAGQSIFFESDVSYRYINRGTCVLKFIRNVLY